VTRPGPTRRRARGRLALALLLPLTLGGLCEGEGTRRPGAIVQDAIDPRCTPIGGRYPSGFALLSGRDDRAVAMRFAPAGLLRFDLSVTPPRADAAGPVPRLPADSDGDGRVDSKAYRDAGLCPARLPDCTTSPVVGGAASAFPATVLVTTSGYEQVLFYDAGTSALALFELASPPEAEGGRAADRPLFPPAGTAALRTAVSTTRCAYPTRLVDSNGAAIAPSPLCDPERTGFLTRFTAATAVAAGRLFVATSNLYDSGGAAFHPGTVLVHEVTTDPSGRPARVVPHADTPVLFTTAYNPTGLRAHRTPGGRELLLVTVSGALAVGGEVRSDAALDVIDAQQLRVVATVPLGRAGVAAGDVAVDPGGHVALLGAEGRRRLYAVDLSVLDDPALYAPRGEPVVLDGSTPGFPDARIFDERRPLELPRRPDGPPDALCTTRTDVTMNDTGTLAYTTDWCDGTLSVVAIDWRLPLETPLSPERFEVVRRFDWLAPKWPANFGLPAAPSRPRTRPGRPGVDFEGPDLFFLVNEPEGQLCSARVEM